MAINWEEIEKTFGADAFARPAEIGKTYKVKMKDATMWEASAAGNVPFSFSFEDDDNCFYPFSRSYYLSFKEGKDGWRCHYAKALLMLLGVSEDAAKKTVETAESKKERSDVLLTYEAAFKKAAKKGAMVEILIRQKTDVNGTPKTRTTKKGKVVPATEAVFTDRSVAFSSDLEVATPSSDNSTSGDEEEIDIADIPF